MKRAFALFLSMVLSVLFFAPIALAEENGLASMGLDDLLALRQSIESEITARLASDASIMYAGVYYAGKDIREGRYVITCTEEISDKLLVTVFASEDNYDNYTYHSSQGSELTARKEYSMMDEYIAMGNSVYVGLETGMVLKVKNGVGQAQLVEMNWAP